MKLAMKLLRKTEANQPITMAWSYLGKRVV
jgi:hypothetical protein